MEDEKHAHHAAHFQEVLDSLKSSMAHLTSLLDQALKNVFREGLSNLPTIFLQTQTTTL